MEHGTSTSHRAKPADPATLEGVKATSHRQDRTDRGWQPPGAWLLGAVLAVQAALSLRLVKADTAFQDEALYLWAGHREIAHLLHGSPLPPFPSYFSGAPVIYPLLGAFADGIGGLTAARILSLIFMLGTTGLLWAVTRKIYGPTAAFFSAALFAVLGPTLHLGSFATYDAMSVFLVALSVWFVVKAGDRRDATGWMIAAGVTLALANATAYSIALFDPVVVALALITAFPAPGGKRAISRCLILLTVLIVLLGIGLLVGGSYYRNGIEITTLHRAPGVDSALRVLSDSFAWTGTVAIIALIAVIISLIRRPWTAQSWLPPIVTCALLLVPAEQAFLHTTASLSKHGTMGTWFAAIAAGFAVEAFISSAGIGRARAVTFGACVAALALPTVIGIGQARTFSTDWPNSASFVAILRPLVDNSSGRVLVEDPSIAEYYLPAGSQWQRWSGTRNIVLPSGHSTGGPSSKAGVVGSGNAGVYAVFVQEGYFSLVALNFADTTALDRSIGADLRANHHYRIIDVVPYGPGRGTYVIWRYGPRR
jgi:4-amino-4-deoxy-L-arabinose transferase-like glycosyltransferase